MAMSPRYNTNREYENLINEIRVEQGLTLKELASKIGVSPGHMWHISNAYTGPYFSTTAKLKDWAVKLQEVFGYELSEIFPREVCSLQTSNLTNDQLAYIAHGYLGPSYGEYDIDRFLKCLTMKEGIHKFLTPRERVILHYRYELDQEFSHIAELFNLSTQRCRQIEREAIHVLGGYVQKSYGLRGWWIGWFHQRKRALQKRRVSLIPEYPFTVLLRIMGKHSMFG
jgi:transcriptional regulator with XRE-family HTH domain